MTQKFYLISDIHYDTYKEPINFHINPETYSEEYPLVIAGDIANGPMKTLAYLKHIRQFFKYIVFVPGNHDFVDHIRRPYSEIDLIYREECEKLDVTYLNNYSVCVGGINFVGSTGWYDLKAGNGFSFEQAKEKWESWYDTRINWESLRPWDLAFRSYQYLENAMAVAAIRNQQCVDVTHMVPDRALILQKPEDPEWTLCNAFFCNTLLEKIPSDNISAWCYGHTHFRKEKLRQNIMYYNNALGYPGENKVGWAPLLIEV